MVSTHDFTTPGFLFEGLDVDPREAAVKSEPHCDELVSPVLKVQRAEYRRLVLLAANSLLDELRKVRALTELAVTTQDEASILVTELSYLSETHPHLDKIGGRWCPKDQALIERLVSEGGTVKLKRIELPALKTEPYWGISGRTHLVYLYLDVPQSKSERRIHPEEVVH